MAAGEVKRAVKVVHVPEGPPAVTVADAAAAAVDRTPLATEKRARVLQAAAKVTTGIMLVVMNVDEPRSVKDDLVVSRMPEDWLLPSGQAVLPPPGNRHWSALCRNKLATKISGNFTDFGGMDQFLSVSFSYKDYF